MGTKVGLFVDINNLYYYTNRLFDGRKIDYQKLMDKVSKDNDIVYAFAYGTDSNPGFITCLKKYGYDVLIRPPKPKEHRANTNVDLTLDVIRVMDRIDKVILCSSDSDLVPLIQYMQERRIKVIVYATSICQVIRNTAYRCHEINEDLLENNNGEKLSVKESV